MRSGEVTIRAVDLGKRYLRVHDRGMILREALAVTRRQEPVADDFWALRQVSVELAAGDALGVVGTNGSGKSTFLNLVAGTVFPSEGRISTRGRVSTLLSYGAGFKKDMSGEENILASAGLLGMRVRETRQLMAKIIEFAELESVIDTPLRFFSTGMIARLGFAIAIYVSPDILVIDEVLAVGDIRFQEKCKGAIDDLRKRGTTIILATQTPATISDFCSEAIWLEKGLVRQRGEASVVAKAYAEAMRGVRVGERR